MAKLTWDKIARKPPENVGSARDKKKPGKLRVCPAPFSCPTRDMSRDKTRANPRKTAVPPGTTPGTHQPKLSRCPASLLSKREADRDKAGTRRENSRRSERLRWSYFPPNTHSSPSAKPTAKLQRPSVLPRCVKR